jgi:hypothetical protein
VLAVFAALVAGACGSRTINSSPAATAQPGPPIACSPARVDSSPILWSCVIPPGTAPLVHGLSGLYFDAPTSTLFAASDDDSTYQGDSARVLRFRLTPGPTVATVGVVSLQRRGLVREQSPAWQLEAIAPVTPGARSLGFFVATENDALAPALPSQIYRCTENGLCEPALALPREFVTDAVAGVGIQRNLGIEGLTVSPDGQQLFAAFERSLAQEQPGPGRRERSRIIAHAADGSGGWRQFAYALDPPPAHETLGPGVSEVLAVSASRLLVLERGFSPTCGNTIRLFEAAIDPRRALRAGESVNDVTPLSKRLLIDFAAEKDAFAQPKLSDALDNFEGMTPGPSLPDGSETLLLISDDNLRPDQITALVGVNLTALPAASARRWRDGDPPVCPRSVASPARPRDLPK